MTAWSIRNERIKNEFSKSDYMWDMVIGREGTPLASRIALISHNERCCYILDKETFAEVKSYKFDSSCLSIAADNNQTLIVVGTENEVIFICTTNLIPVKKICLDNSGCSPVFNKRNDCMLALTRNGKLHSFNFSAVQD